MRALLAAVLALAAALPARASPADRAAALRSQGAKLMSRGLYPRAAELYRQAAALRGSDRELLKDLMWAEWRAGDRDGTIETAARALALKKDDLEVLNLLASAQFAAERYDDAFRSYRASDALAPGQPRVRQALAELYERTYEKEKDYENALKYCDVVLADRPDEHARHAQRARLLFQLGRYDEAETSWREAIALSTGSFDYSFQLARTRYYAGRREDALRDVAGLLKDDPHRKAALEFLIQAAVVADERDWALPALERVLQDGRPEEEAVMLVLGKLYEDLKRPKDALRTYDRVLSLDPDSGAGLRARGEFLEASVGAEAALADFERLVRLNPTSAREWQRLALSLSTVGRTREALAAIRKARELNPDDPDLLITDSRIHEEAGQEDAARAMLKSWLAANKEEKVLPVLLYHGLASRDDDPILASPVHITTAAFVAQMKSLRAAGFAPVTSAEAAAWFHGAGELPPRPVLITFDDARLDALRPADPVLQEFGLKATMFAPLSNVEPGLPGYASWDELKKYQDTGRWEIEAHGDRGHTFIRKDAQGRLARFLTNRLWLESEGRLETTEEWARRVAADHESSKKKIFEHLGSTPTAFAFPEGEYGQAEAPNVPDAADLGLKLCADSYAVCFVQDDQGLNVRSMDPSRAVRVEPRRDWTGERLVELIRDQSPFVQARRTLLRQLAWTGKTREAGALLEENRRAGVSEWILLNDEARIRAATGDRDAALRLAQRAWELEPGPENLQLIADMTRPAPLRWRPELAYGDDSDGRVSRVFRQTLGSWPELGLDNVSQFHAGYSEKGVPAVTDDGAGFELARAVIPDQTVDVQLEGHILGAGAPDTFGVLGSLTSRWSDSLVTTAQAGHEPYLYAHALLAGVRERLVSGSGVWGDADSFQLSGRLKFASLTDHNERYTGAASALEPVPQLRGVRGVVQFATDGVDFVSPNYYSPLHLRTYSAGLDYTDKPLPWLTASVRYLPGYATEGGAPGSFAQQLDASASLQRGILALRPSISYTRTPTYRSNTYGLGVDIDFTGPGAEKRRY